MKEHAWKANEYDGGTVGTYAVFECAECGACAGDADLPGATPGNPFYANGSGLKLTDDCAESKRLVAAFELGAQFGVAHAPRPQSAVSRTVSRLVKKLLRRHGPI